MLQFKENEYPKMMNISKKLKSAKIISQNDSIITKMNRNRGGIDDTLLSLNRR